MAAQEPRLAGRFHVDQVASMASTTSAMLAVPAQPSKASGRFTTNGPMMSERWAMSIITAITEGMFHPSMKAKMDTLEAEKASVTAHLRQIPAEDPVAIHPGLADIYAKRVANLAESLNVEDTKAEAADILRGLIDKIILQPDPDAPNGHKIELYGELGAILSLCDIGIGTNAKARSGATGVRQVTVVAGAGYIQEPTLEIAA